MTSPPYKEIGLHPNMDWVHFLIIYFGYLLFVFSINKKNNDDLGFPLIYNKGTKEARNIFKLIFFKLIPHTVFFADKKH